MGIPMAVGAESDTTPQTITEANTQNVMHIQETAKIPPLVTAFTFA
jgi:hypothetical protein